MTMHLSLLNASVQSREAEQALAVDPGNPAGWWLQIRLVPVQHLDT
jgi:hypothetical protein